MRLRHPVSRTSFLRSLLWSTSYRVACRRKSLSSLKVQVIFRKRATNYRALWRKMTHKDKASYDSTPQDSSVDERVAVCCSVLQCVAVCLFLDMDWLRLAGFLKIMSLLQNIVSFTGLFCKRELSFSGAY